MFMFELPAVVVQGGPGTHMWQCYRRQQVRQVMPVTGALGAALHNTAIMVLAWGCAAAAGTAGAVLERRRQQQQQQVAAVSRVMLLSPV